MSWTITPSNTLVDDPDALAYLAAVQAADSASLESGVRLAVNAFVKGCKADGIWPAIKASCILAGARTLAGALVPLVGTAPTNPSNVFVQADYNRKTGLAGDGSTKYLNSNRNQNQDPQNSKHGFVYVTTAPTGLATHLGSFDTSYFAILRQSDGRLTSIINAEVSASSNEASPAGDRTGAIGVSRNNSADYNRRSSSITTTVALVSVASSVRPTFIFARNNSGTPDVFANARLAFYSIGEAIDLALLDARVTTLINALAVAIP